MLPNSVTHSSLDLFQKPPVLVNFDYANVQKVFPTSGYDGPDIEFELKTDRNVFLDLQDISLAINIEISNPTLTTDAQRNAWDPVHMIANNHLHSIFSGCDVLLNGETVSHSNGLYAHKAFLTTEWSHTTGCKEAILSCQGYKYERDPSTPATVKRERYGAGGNAPKRYHLYGRLAVDFFNCEQLLLPKSHLRIKLEKAKKDFVLIQEPIPNTADNADLQKPYQAGSIHFKITKAILFAKQMVVSENVYSSIEKAWMKSPAKYNFIETEAKTSVIPRGQNVYVRENVFNNKPIRSMVIAMNTNTAFQGNIEHNPFNYQKFGLKRVIVSRNGIPIYDIDTDENSSANVQAFHTTMKSLHFGHDGPGIKLSDYPHHFVIALDLTATNQSNSEIYYPELTGGAITLQLEFNDELADSVEVLTLGEYLTTVYLKNTGEVYKE